MSAKNDLDEQLKQARLEQIKKEFPDIKIDDSRLINHGWDHDVIVLNNQEIFRFPKDNEQQESFKRELQFLKYLKDKTTVPIPDYKYVASDQSFGGYPLLKGEEVFPEKFALLSVEQKDNVAQQLGEFLTVIHTTPIVEIERIGYVEKTGGHFWSREDAEKRFQRIKELVLPKLTEKERGWVEKNCEEYLSFSFNYQKVLLHSDITAAHLLVDVNQGKLSGVIDFGDVEIGDPALDFAGLFYYYGEDFGQKVVDYYKGQVDPDMIKRAHYPVRLSAAGHFLEIIEGDHIPLNWEQAHDVLVKVMKKYGAID